jgi:hypothetical protein
MFFTGMAKNNLTTWHFNPVDVNIIAGRLQVILK